MTRLPELLTFRPRLNSSTTFSFALAAVIIVTVTSYANAQTGATMLSPANGSTASGSITVSASISGTYASVVFWRDNWVQIGQSSSRELSFNSGSISNGSHQFFVSVLDSKGNTLCASNIVTVNVQNATTATMASPSNNAQVSGATTISATVNAPNGYASVAFWVDNWVKIGQETSPQLSYNTAALANGNHNFFVTVLDSSGAALAASNIITANVQNQGIPTLTMTSPANGTAVSGTITVSASVTGSTSGVTFYGDSWSNPIGTVAAAPYQMSYNTGSLSNANHTFWATATNQSGSGASNIVSVTIQNSGSGQGCTPVPQMAQYDQHGFDMLAALNNTNTGKNGPYFGAADTTWDGGWYFVSLAYLGYVDLMPGTVKGYISYYLQNTNSDWSIGVMGQNRDSDDSYAATLLSLASAYYRVTCDQAFFSTTVQGKGVTVMEALKDVANNNLVNARFSNGLVHVFQNEGSDAVAYTMDNAEDYKGLEDFGKFLSSIGDGSASTYLNAAAALANGMQQLYQSNLYNGTNYLNQSGFAWAWFPSSGPGWMDNPITLYPDGTAQVFPQLYRVPIPSYMNADGWSFLRNNFDFESPCGSSCDPWTSLGLAAAYNGDNSTANVMLTNTRSTGGTPIHEWGFYRRTVLYQENGFVY